MTGQLIPAQSAAKESLLHSIICFDTNTGLICRAVYFNCDCCCCSSLTLSVICPSHLFIYTRHACIAVAASSDGEMRRGKNRIYRHNRLLGGGCVIDKSEIEAFINHLGEHSTRAVMRTSEPRGVVVPAHWYRVWTRTGFPHEIPESMNDDPAMWRVGDLMDE